MSGDDRVVADPSRRLSPEARARLARELASYKAAKEPRPWEKQARTKQLWPDHPRHHLPWKNPKTGISYSCGCDGNNSDWTTWIFLAGRGTGKRLDIKTPIITPRGWKLLGDLNPGDYVFDHAGKPTRVLAVYDGMPEVAYRLTFSDGSTLDADADHLWTTWTHLDRKHYLRGGARDFGPDWPAWR